MNQTLNTGPVSGMPAQSQVTGFASTSTSSIANLQNNPVLNPGLSGIQHLPYGPGCSSVGNNASGSNMGAQTYGATDLNVINAIQQALQFDTDGSGDCLDDF